MLRTHKFSTVADLTLPTEASLPGCQVLSDTTSVFCSLTQVKQFTVAVEQFISKVFDGHLHYDQFVNDLLD